MAVRDILTLSNPMAPRLVRCLYIAALVLITVMVVFGLIRGVRVMTFQPQPRPAATSPQTSDAQTPYAQVPGAAQTGPRAVMDPARRQAMRQMMARRFERGRFMRRGPFGGFGPFPRQPLLSGLFIILGTLLRGAIILMVVRILAELAQAILAMPPRSEI